jgi:hypothetical protein
MIKLILMISLICIPLVGCKTCPTTHAECRKLVEPLGGMSLSRAAFLTVRDARRANYPATGFTMGPDVPRQWWHESIRKLHPARVYMHHYDLVVVLSESETTEVGLCINTPGASHVGGPMTNKAVEFRAVYNPETENPNTIFGGVSSYMKRK